MAINKKYNNFLTAGWHKMSILIIIILVIKAIMQQTKNFKDKQKQNIFSNLVP